MPYQIIRNDITRVKADVIVNTANPHPVIGRGTDSAIYAAAGEKQLLAARKEIGDIARGEVAVTPAFNLPAKYIIHTVGPSWEGGDHGERDILHACYRNSLRKAAELKAESIAFPLIATGVYGFPKDEALKIAMAEIQGFVLEHDMKVILVVFDMKAFELSGRLVGEIDQFIDEHGVGAAREAEYGDFDSEEWRRRRIERRQAEAEKEMRFRSAEPENAGASSGEKEDRSLDEMLLQSGETFQQQLFRYIKDRGLKNSTVYNRANMDRKLFSKISKNVNYQPKKKTALALAIALELDLPDVEDLISRAGFALSPSNRADLIVEYFVTQKKYDIMEIDSALFDYGQPTLFSEE